MSPPLINYLKESLTVLMVGLAGLAWPDRQAVQARDSLGRGQGGAEEMRGERVVKGGSRV